MTVAVARTAAPGTSPVEASTPDGTSTATTGCPAALIELDHARGVLARRVVQADAEQRVDDHVRLAEVADALDDRHVAPAPRAARARRRGRRRRCCPCRRRPSTRPGKRLQHDLGDGAAGALHQLLHRAGLVRLLGRAGSRRRSGAAASLIRPGASRIHHDRHGGGQLARMRHRELDPAGADLLRPGGRAPAQVDARLRAAADLDLLPGEVDAASRAPSRPPPWPRSGRRSAEAGSASRRSRRARPA